MTIINDNTLKTISINIGSTIKAALEAIDKGGIQVCFIIDKKNNFIGTVSDGDIRRALLRGININQNVDIIVNKKSYFVKEDFDESKVVDKMKSLGIRSAPIINYKNKLIGLKRINIPNKNVYKNSIIIMVGGLGKRLYPLTKSLPKCMLEISGKPILEIILNKFESEGFNNIYLCVNFKSEIIKNYFGDGNKFNLNIHYIEEKKRLGTAGALSLIRKKFKLPLIVVNGDVLTKVNYFQVLNFHLQSKSDATVAVREHNYEVPFGVVESNKDLITKITEKPIEKFFVNSGIYILEPDLLNLIPKNEFYDMPTLINKIIHKKYKVASYLIREYWLDIGRNSELKKARDEYV